MPASEEDDQSLSSSFVTDSIACDCYASTAATCYRH